ncbi:MAG: choice-of-anchor Q domain-containing protein [Acidobacteriota bacterium]
MSKTARFLTAFLMGLLALPGARAATLTWSAGSSGSWSDGANWTVTDGTDTDGIPDADDLLVFDETSSADASIDTNLTVLGVRVIGSYAGTVSLGSSELTVRSEFGVGNVGGFDGGTGLIRLGGSVTFDSAAPIHDLELAGFNSITLSQDLAATGDVTITDLFFFNGPGALLVSGDVTADDPNGWSGGGVLSMVGDGDQSLDGIGRLSNLTVDQGPGARVLVSSEVELSGALTGDGTIVDDGGRLIVASTWSSDFAGTIESLEVVGFTSITLTQDLTVLGPVTFTDVFFFNGPGSLRVAGDVTATDADGWAGGGVLSLIGDIDQTLDGTGRLSNLDVAQGVGARVLVSSEVTISGALTGDGTIVDDGGRLIVAATWSSDFAGTIGSLEVVGFTSITLTQDLSVAGAVTFTDVFFFNGPGAVLVGGDVTATDADGWSGGGLTRLVGDGDQTISGAGRLTQVDINKPSGDVVFDGFTGDFSTLFVSTTWDVLGNTVTAGSFRPDGGTLTGTGTLDGNVNVGVGGTLDAGSSPGTLNIDGNLAFQAGATLHVDVEGDAPGTEHDQLVVTGTVSLAGATLSAAILGETTGPIVIIDNDAAEGISGTFGGAAEGAPLVGGTVSYVGGDGNDVVLADLPGPETDCANGTDDNGDGTTDCDDPACFDAGPCNPESACNDDVDNDLDTLTDCDDPDCVDNVACIPEPDCDDGTDEDLDGLTDCMDPDCFGDPACPPESDCTNDVDDDFDGMTDCADPNCNAEPACQEALNCDDGIDNDVDGNVDCDDNQCELDPSCINFINVTTTADDLTAGDGQCSLREAIINANRNDELTSGDCETGEGVNVVAVPAGHYVLTIAGENEDFGATGDFDLRSRVWVRGAGPAFTVIDGNGLDRVFDLWFDRNEVSNLTVTGGHAVDDSLDCEAGGIFSAGRGDGGGIRSQHGDFNHLANLRITDNECRCNGGGLAATGSVFSGSNVVIDGNVAGRDAGGIEGWRMHTSGQNLYNWTISGNTAAERAGGVLHNSGCCQLSFVGATITGNHAGTEGGGVYQEGFGLTLRGCIIAGNTSGGAALEDDCVPAVSASNSVLGLDGESGGCVVGDGSIVPDGGIETVLDPVLRDNGGILPSHALVAGSPAIDRQGQEADRSRCGTELWEVDGRGAPRPLDDGNCDAGAVEFGSVAPCLDCDGDGVTDDLDNCPDTFNPGQVDRDGDGLGDPCDPNGPLEMDCQDGGDEDGDGDVDCADADCASFAGCVETECDDGLDDEPDGAIDCLDLDCVRDVACGDEDTDGDGIPNAQDNCAGVFNPHQEDVNGNGVGELCEVTYLFTAEDPAGLDLVSFLFFVEPPRGVRHVEAVAGAGLDLDWDCDAPGLGFEPSSLQCVSDGAAVTGTAAEFGRFVFEHLGTAPTCEDLDFGPGPPNEWLDDLLGDATPESITCEVSDCLPGDVHPDGLGDGRVSLADYVVSRRKVLGTVDPNPRDLECADLHPGVVTCDGGNSTSTWCPEGDAEFTFGDSMVIRRMVMRIYALGCDSCASVLSASVPAFVPGDAVPREGRDGRVDIADVVFGLQVAVGLVAPSDDELQQLDVAPVETVGEQSLAWGDESVTIADVVALLRSAVGLDELTWPERELSLVLEDAQVPSVGFSQLVEGWPEWAEVTDWTAGPCGPEGDADARFGDAGFVVTCVTDPAPFEAPAELVRVTYRGRSAVLASELTLTTELLDEHLIDHFGRVTALD